MTGKDGFTTIDGLRIHYVDWNTGESATILYFHVYSGNAHEADAFARRVAGKCRVVSVDARGHGESDWGPADRYTPDRYFQDGLAVRDSLGIEKPILMGSSFGAATALRMAASEPERALALVMDDQPPEMPGGRTADPLLKTFERQQGETFASLDDLVAWGNRMRGRSWGWKLPDEQIWEWARHATKPLPDGRYGWRHDPETLRGLAPFAGKPEADLRPAFASLSVPALVARRIGPGASLDGPIWDELQVLNPRARFLTFPEAGHPVTFTQPDALAEAVLSFLADTL